MIKFREKAQEGVNALLLKEKLKDLGEEIEGQVKIKETDKDHFQDHRVDQEMNHLSSLIDMEILFNQLKMNLIQVQDQNHKLSHQFKTTA